MTKARIGLFLGAAAALLAACNQTTMPETATPRTDPIAATRDGGVTRFDLALEAAGNSPACMRLEWNFSRNATVTIKGPRAELKLESSVRDVLDPVRPNVYGANIEVGGAQANIVADLSGVPRRLTIVSLGGGCRWSATAP